MTQLVHYTFDSILNLNYINFDNKALDGRTVIYRKIHITLINSTVFYKENMKNKI